MNPMKENYCRDSNPMPLVSIGSISPVTIRVFKHKYNLLIISSIQQLHYIFNEEEY